MEIKIIYKVPTAYGNWRTYGITAYTLKEAAEICEACETLGYTIADVTREE